MAVEVRDRTAAVRRGGGAATLGGGLTCLGAVGLWIRPGATLPLGVLVLGACLTVLGVPGLVLRTAGRARPLSFSALVLGFAGLAATLLGIGLVALSALGGRVASVTSAAVPFAATAGAFGVIGAAFFVGLSSLWTGTPPRPVGVLLLLGSATIVGFDTGGSQALLALPLGLGWLAAGVALWLASPSVEQEQQVPDEDE